MSALTRRRYPERVDCWHVFYGDVQVGTIARRTGCPVDVDQWEWSCGFYPGMGPDESQSDTAMDFEQACTDSEASWRLILPTPSEANFQEWRDQRNWTTQIYHVGHAASRCRPRSQAH